LNFVAMVFFFVIAFWLSALFFWWCSDHKAKQED
jgi:hypothetical protein